MADINAKIQLELVDGPAQKALADFVKTSGAADKSVAGLNKSLGGLSKGVDANSVSFSGFAKIISDDFGGKGSQAVGQFAALLSGPLVVALGAVASAALVVKKALDLTLLAERNDQISNSFNAIAASAGLAGDSLKEGLLAATQGLADDDDVLRAANKAIIELGDNAGRIPEIMEVARKTTALFGGELVTNFESLSQALASGNTKALRNIGLIIDADKAQREYAASIGYTVAQLSDSGKKQAVTNAALEQAKAKFANVDESSTKATQALQRFKISGGELIDVIAKAVQSSKFFAATFDVLNVALTKTSDLIKRNFGSNIDQLDGKLSGAKQRVAEYGDELVKLQDRLGRSGPTQKGAVLDQIERTKSKLVEAKLEVEDTIKAIGRLSKTTVPAQTKEEGAKVNREAILKERTDAAKRGAEAELAIAQSAAELENEILRNKLATRQITQEEFNQSAFASEQEAYAARRETETQRFLEENALLEQKFAGALNAESGYIGQRDALYAQFLAKSNKYDAEELKSKTKLNQEQERLNQLKVAAVKDTFGNLASLMQTSSRELFAIGKAAAIASATINTYEAITKTMASVPYPFNIPLAAAQGIAGFVQVSNIASQNPSFASGGIVPGTSYTGDKVTANVNSGEMVLNKTQQANLFSQLNGSGGSSMDRTNQLLEILASRDENIIVNIGGRTVVETLRSELAGGRRFE